MCLLVCFYIEIFSFQSNWDIQTSNSMLSEHSVRKCSDIDQSIFSDTKEKTKIHLALERDGEIIANSLDAKGMEDLSSYYLETNEWKTEAILYEKHPLIKEACRGDNLRVIKTTSGNDKGKSIYLHIFCHNMAIYKCFKFSDLFCRWNFV